MRQRQRRPPGLDEPSGWARDDFPRRGRDGEDQDGLRAPGCHHMIPDLVAERLTGRDAEGFTNAAMRWGTDMEPQAKLATNSGGASVEKLRVRQNPSIAGIAEMPDGFVGEEIDCRDRKYCPPRRQYRNATRFPIADKYVKRDAGGRWPALARVVRGTVRSPDAGIRIAYRQACRSAARKHAVRNWKPSSSNFTPARLTRRCLADPRPLLRTANRRPSRRDQLQQVTGDCPSAGSVNKAILVRKPRRQRFLKSVVRTTAR